MSEHVALVSCLAPSLLLVSLMGCGRFDTSELAAEGLLDPCADARGYCVPGELLPPEQGALLMEQGCTGGLGCAPAAVVEGVPLAACRLPQGLRGRCVDRVFLQALDDLPLQRAQCDAQARCVPCFNPLRGEATGVCALPGDLGLECGEPTWACH